MRPSGRGPIAALPLRAANCRPIGGSPFLRSTCRRPSRRGPPRPAGLPRTRDLPIDLGGATIALPRQATLSRGIAGTLISLSLSLGFSADVSSEYGQDATRAIRPAGRGHSEAILNYRT